ncbi:MAG: alginate export family protein [Ignavibacteria bacterium]|nr:alginate export family protein [Ignavibacteria bacterium]
MKRFILLLVLIFSIAQAQERVKFSGQIRPRFEIDNKDFKSTTEANTFTAFRTRFGVSLLPTANTSGYIQIQDSRIFGEETSTTTNMKNLDLHQAYIKIDNLFDLPFDLKAGRFEMSYGSERFIGSVNWNNVGRSFDGAILSLKGEKFKIDFIGSREFERARLGDTLDQNVYGAFVDLMIIKNYKIQPFVIMQNSVKSEALKRTTFGFYVMGDLGQFVHEIDFGYQTGSLISLNRKQDIGAYTFSFNAGYTFDTPLKPFFGAQLDIASGDDNLADNDYSAYASLYGTGHKFFGYMDYFTSFPNDAYGVGISDLVIKGALSPIAKLKLNLHFHLFNSMQDYSLISGAKTKQFGSEIDFVASYKYNEAVTFEGGFSFFSPGEIFKERRGKDSASWGYFMAVVNF